MNNKTFFTHDIIESYVNYELNGVYPIKDALGSYELLNYNEFMSWWNDYLGYPNSLHIKEHLIDYHFKSIFTERCLDLSEGYIHKTINSLKSNSNFDALFAVYKKNDITLDKENPSKIDIYNYQEKKSKSVGGFIVVEKGECKKQSQKSLLNVFNYFNNKSTEKEINYNNVYSVFLICSQYISLDEPAFTPIKGQLLMGAYLFTIKSNSILQQIAVLELLSGYRNIPGFIAYSKLGFEKDLKLYARNCFYSLNNLPMSNNLTNKNTTDIIQIVAKDVDLIISPESRNIINFYELNKTNEKKQVKLATFCNMLYKLELEPHYILKNLIEVYDHDENYDNMESIIGDEETRELTSVFYNKKSIDFDPCFVSEDDYDQDRNIKDKSYDKIIVLIKKYYEEQIHKMLNKRRNGGNKHTHKKNTYAKQNNKSKKQLFTNKLKTIP
jgi:hypothetical protein